MHDVSHNKAQTALTFSPMRFPWRTEIKTVKKQKGSIVQNKLISSRAHSADEAWNGKVIIGTKPETFQL